jgi:hypothetical protein
MKRLRDNNNKDNKGGGGGGGGNSHRGGALTRWAPTNAAPRSIRLRRSKTHVNRHRCPPEPRLVAANNRAMWEASTRPVQCGAWHANSEYLRRRSKRGRDIRHTSPKMLRIITPRVKSGSAAAAMPVHAHRGVRQTTAAVIMRVTPSTPILTISVASRKGGVKLGKSSPDTIVSKTQV